MRAGRRAAYAARKGWGAGTEHTDTCPRKGGQELTRGSGGCLTLESGIEADAREWGVPDLRKTG